MKLTDFKKYYQGFDASLSISLFEYGFIYSYTDPLSKGDLRVWFKVLGKTFDWADFRKDLDFWKEFNWIDENSKKGFLSYLGIDEKSFNSEPLENKINWAASYYGYENIYGTAYNPTVITE